MRWLILGSYILLLSFLLWVVLVVFFILRWGGTFCAFLYHLKLGENCLFSYNRKKCVNLLSTFMVGFFKAKEQSKTESSGFFLIKNLIFILVFWKCYFMKSALIVGFCFWQSPMRDWSLPWIGIFKWWGFFLSDFDKLNVCVTSS